MRGGVPEHVIFLGLAPGRMVRTFTGRGQGTRAALGTVMASAPDRCPRACVLLWCQHQVQSEGCPANTRLCAPLVALWHSWAHSGQPACHFQEDARTHLV